MTDIHVELDIYSGRPNPEWVLTELEASVFSELFCLLAPIAADPVPETRLGYRGFIATDPGGSIEGYDKLWIYRGRILATHETGTHTFADPALALETWLLLSARGRVAEPTLRHLEDENREFKHGPSDGPL